MLFFFLAQFVTYPFGTHLVFIVGRRGRWWCLWWSWNGFVEDQLKLKVWKSKNTHLFRVHHFKFHKKATFHDLQDHFHEVLSYKLEKKKNTETLFLVKTFNPSHTPLNRSKTQSFIPIQFIRHTPQPFHIFYVFRKFFHSPWDIK